MVTDAAILDELFAESLLVLILNTTFQVIK